MATTAFTNKVTEIPVDWANDINRIAYTVLGNPTSAADARSALGVAGALGFSQAAVAVTGGTIDGVSIGSSTPSTGAFTTATLTTVGATSNSIPTKGYVDSAVLGVTAALGTMSSQSASSVAITGGTLSGVALTSATAALSSGSVTAAPTASTHIVNKTYVDTLFAALPVFGTMAAQNATSVTLTGGSVNNITIGLSTPTTAGFTNVTAQSVTGVHGKFWADGSNASFALGGAVVASISAAKPNLYLKAGTSGEVHLAAADNASVVTMFQSKRVGVGDNPADDGVNQFQVYGDIRSNQLVLNNAPTLGTHAATKTYTDGAVSALNVTLTAAIAASTSGFGTMSAQAATSVAITGGSINGATIGISAPAAGRFSSLIVTGSPVTGTDATNKTYVDAAISTSVNAVSAGLGTIASQSAAAVAVTGGTLTGVTLTSSTGTFSALSCTAAATTANHVTNKTYVDTAVSTAVALLAPLTGAVFTGAVTLNADPTLALHPASKQYADALVPVGTIVYRSLTSPPAGYLRAPATGTTASRTAYSALYAVLGTSAGVGDGSTTFGLPHVPDITAGPVTLYGFIKH